jgi:NADPH2:quinone reductase
VIDQRRAELRGLLTADRLRPACTVLPLRQIAEAVELISSRGNLGRVLLHTD